VRLEEDAEGCLDMEISIGKDGARVGTGSATNDKAPQCGACAVRERIGYDTRSSACAEHRLVVMRTTGVVRAMEPVKGRGLRYAMRIRQAYRNITLPHNPRPQSRPENG